MKKEKDEKQYIYKKNLLSRQGWTEKAINIFLPQPDKEVQNPKYKSAASSKLYEAEKVEAIENSEDFKIFIERNKSRVKGANQAVLTKYTQTIDYVNNLVIEVPLIEKSNLLQLAVRHYDIVQEDWFYNKGGDRKQDVPKTASIDSDESFLQRITINYLRHQMTDYDNELIKIFGKVGTDKAYLKLKDRINQAILDKYDWLK